MIQSAMVTKKTFYAGICLLSLLLMVCCLEAQAGGLKVGLIGDQTWSPDLRDSYAVMEKGIALLMKQGPDIIVHTGDIIESTLDPAEISANFNYAAGMLEKTGIPWYLTVGDHDVNPPLYQPGSTDRSREELFLSLYRRHNQALKDLYYSFDKNDYHFIVLYSSENLHTDPRWGNIFLSQIGARQYEWLEGELKKHKDKKGIIVFVHQPLWYNWANWAPVHRLLSQYPAVAAVVAGHFHYNQDEGLLDGIRYLVVGATGGQIKNADPVAGGVHHVTLMTIHEDRRIEFLPLPVPPRGNLAFASRFDMERVQALEYVLGNLWNFADVNRVYVKEDRKLVNDCSSDEPARVRLSSMGNPIDVPVDLTVDLLSMPPVIGLSSSLFHKDARLTVKQSTCSLKPSYGVTMANASFVKADDRANPLWMGELYLTGERETANPLSIGLMITLSFSGDDKGKRLRLYNKTKDVLVVPCPRFFPGNSLPAR